MRRIDRTWLRKSRSAWGFTLLELMAAIGLSGIAVVTIGLLVRQIDVTREMIARTAAREDASANGARTLRELIGRAEMTSDSARQFAGDAGSTSVPTWCDVPGGWLERCMVRIALDHRGDSTAVYAQFDGRDDLQLAVYPGTLTLAYLGTMVGGRTWTTMWGRGVVPPTAIGLVRQGGDTIVVLIRDRG